MKDKFSFNVCSFIGMLVMMLAITSIFKSLGISISSAKVSMMIGVIFLFALFADVFFKILFYFFVARVTNPWMWSEQRENYSYFVREDLKENRLSEIVTVIVILVIGYYLTYIFLSPYSFQIGTLRLNLVVLFLAALWLGGLIIGGFLYVVFHSFTDSHKS